jgi:cellulose biosynthesis protein BcsQ
VSRFFDAVRRADETRQHSLDSTPMAPTPSGGRTLAVVSNKGGVGKTTVATNLAIYLRALREDLPVLLIGLDDQATINRMFAIEKDGAGPTIADALRAGSLAGAIRLGNYGVHYVASSPRIGDLKREIHDPDRLRRMLTAADWRGLVILDTKSDLEILSQNALCACDLALVLARDLGSVTEAAKVFELLRLWGRPRDCARMLLSLVDLRVKYASGQTRDILSLLLEEIRRLEYPLLGTFISSSPKIESLHTNPDRVTRSILHGAPNSLVHRQMQHLAEELLAILRPRAGSEAESEAESEQDAAERPLRPLGVDVAAWLGVERESPGSDAPLHVPSTG